MQKRLLTGVFVAALMINSSYLSLTVNAETTEELEQKRQKFETQSTQINKNIQEKEDQLGNLEIEEETFTEDMKQLQLKIDGFILQLQKEEKNLEESKVKIKELQTEINSLKTLILQREKKLKFQARAVQTDGNVSNLVDVVFSSGTFTDLVGRIGIVNQLVTANKEIVIVQEKNKKLLEKNEKKAKEEILAIETVKSSIEISKSNLVAQKLELDDKITKVAAAYDMTALEKTVFVKKQQAVAAQTSMLSSELEEKREKIIEEEKAKQADAQKAAEDSAGEIMSEEFEEESIVVNQQDSSTGSNNSSLAGSKNPAANEVPLGASNADFIRPSNGYTTSPFGYRIHPITGERKLHGGIDFAGGGQIVAAKSGKVLVAGYHSSWGYYVKIDHGNGIQTLYAHMKAGSLLVSPGQLISQGQQLGTMGTTGASTGVHLHFEVYDNNTRVDPVPYLGL